MAISNRFGYAILTVCSLSLVVSAASLLLTFTQSTNSNLTNNRIAQSILSLRNTLNPDNITEMEELAANRRIANILSYTAGKSFQLSERTKYIKDLATEIRSDTIEKLAYQNLREFGVMNPDLRQTGDAQYTFRGRWQLHIKPGSHFYDNPITSVMFINESFSMPNCMLEKGYEPYVAFMTTNTALDVKIIPDHQAPQPSYRITAFDKKMNPVMDNVTDRIIVDSGCLARNTEEDDSLS